MGALAGWTIVDGLHKINRSNSFVERESRYDAGLCGQTIFRQGSQDQVADL